MSIPLPQKYMRPEGGIGKLANTQATQADTLIASEKIPYGSPIAATNGEAATFSTGDFFGVAIAQDYAEEITYDNAEKVGAYPIHKPVAVLRKGSIWVKVDEDVVMNEKAAASATGFKKSVDATDAIGIFQSSAQAGGLAVLQINLP